MVNGQSCHGVVQFDAAMNKALEKEVTTKATFKGHLDSYRFCDQVSCGALRHLQSPAWCVSMQAMNKASEKGVTTKAILEGHRDSCNFCDQVLCLAIRILRTQQAVSECWLHMKDGDA